MQNNYIELQSGQIEAQTNLESLVNMGENSLNRTSLVCIPNRIQTIPVMRNIYGTYGNSNFAKIGISDQLMYTSKINLHIGSLRYQSS